MREESFEYQYDHHRVASGARGGPRARRSLSDIEEEIGGGPGPGSGGEGRGDSPQCKEGGREHPQGGGSPGQGLPAPNETRFRSGDPRAKERDQPAREATSPEGRHARPEDRGPREPVAGIRKEGKGDIRVGAQACTGKPGTRGADPRCEGEPRADRGGDSRPGEVRTRGDDLGRGQAGRSKEGSRDRGRVQGGGGA